MKMNSTMRFRSGAWNIFPVGRKRSVYRRPLIWQSITQSHLLNLQQHDQNREQHLRELKRTIIVQSSFLWKLSLQNHKRQQHFVINKDLHCLYNSYDMCDTCSTSGLYRPNRLLASRAFMCSAAQVLDSYQWSPAERTPGSSSLLKTAAGRSSSL